ncbi:hypothetical protein CEUSTIGMA_g5884.t1 [Chlamydomonas eustigma]|uniref:Uncharacterized protein n=1 Tax=Chlamydomonas eustigma TaxID=1157962 RepID=A0A250X5U1_9CHLO|nr:hypothetical protein CEUSTIGMA_g5884.t1 [Chlamydomonas eustigma]|eukprot:GAX78443.1 hypothetical protein CEUSTIGMA_g5884.t1 [Chlamydomonas eustigma]
MLNGCLVSSNLLKAAEQTSGKNTRNVDISHDVDEAKFWSQLIMRSGVGLGRHKISLNASHLFLKQLNLQAQTRSGLTIALFEEAPINIQDICSPSVSLLAPAWDHSNDSNSDVPPVVECGKRGDTYQPNRRKRVNSHGLDKRLSTPGGRLTLLRRIFGKKRFKLTVDCFV